MSLNRPMGWAAVALLVPIILLSGVPSSFAAASTAAITVSHSPDQPRSGEKVAITVQTQTPAREGSLALQYQIVDPGKYIALADTAYSRQWTSLPLRLAPSANSAKTAGTMLTSELPGELQKHRRLIRYRVVVSDSGSVVAPAREDPQPNFAYFVYDGIPEWRAAINLRSSDPSLNKVVTFGTNVMRSVQAYHLISKRPSIENATWREPASFGEDDSRHQYKYTGTLVADGRVYDHVRFRARGGVWRHAMGKNMWKIDFNKGHPLMARDDFGRPYQKPWDKLNLGACIQQGDYGMRGEQGMFEAVTFGLFNLVGVEASRTHWAQLRIIDEAQENPDQYRGDFWGLYLAVENPDGNFLEEHRLPDGNLYKIDFGGPKPSHFARGAATNRSDVIRLESGLRRNASESWWRSNVDLPRYYSYRSIIEGVHHYDVGSGKNYYYYINPQTKRWSVVPWDVDLTWGDHMFGDGGEPFYRAGLLQREPFRSEYQNRLVEIRDLLFNPEQAGALIDEYASIIWDPKGGPSMVDADRAKWDYHPIMVSQYIMRGKTEPGLFYQASPTRDFRGMVELMKQYVKHRAQFIDRRLLANARLPAAPAIGDPGQLNFSRPTLTFRLAGTAGDGATGKVKWRVGEIGRAPSASSAPRAPRKYEIEPVWEGEGGSSAEIPTKPLQPGHTYRVRARIDDGTGKWSHWSAPIQFTVTR